MSRRNRYLATLVAAAALLASWGVAPASAIVPPTGGTSKCQFMDTGWIGAGAWSWLDPFYVYDGRLRWDACVVKTSAGGRAAYVQLSALADLYRYDTFTGFVDTYLEQCIPGGGYSVLAHATWLVPGTVTVNPAGRYYFPLIKTATSTTPSNAGYRVRIHSYNAAVEGHQTAQVLALSKYGWAAIPETNNYWYTGCMTP